MRLATVRSIGSPPVLRAVEDVADFEQEIVDQYALAMAAASLSDGHIGKCRSVVVAQVRDRAGFLSSEAFMSATLRVRMGFQESLTQVHGMRSATDIIRNG